MDNLTRAQRRKNMQNVRSTGTRAEKSVIGELRRRRLTFSVYDKSLPGTPDLIFKRPKLAVFVDSDFWHGHRKRLIMPATNKKYWVKKIQTNRARDKRVNRELRSMGWAVIRVWEYDIKKRIDYSINRIIRKRLELLKS